MPQEPSQLDTWWNGLSGEARAEVMRASRSGHMTDDIARSLVAAGISVSDDDRQHARFPNAVTTYLKTRHDS
jgi:hypothetical protein